MADPVLDPTQQESVEMPNGIVLTGVGEQDVDAAREQFEDRHQERTGEAVEAQTSQEQQDSKPRQSRGSKRFDQLTAEREAEKRRADAAEARLKELESKSAPTAPVERVQPPQVQPQTFTRPKPEEAEIGSKYTSLSAYFEDLIKWDREQQQADFVKTIDARVREGIEATQASRSFMDKAQEIQARGRKVYADFDAVLKAVDDIKIHPVAQEALISADNSEHIQYELAKNRSLLEKFAKEPNPVKAGMMLAQFARPAEAVAPLASTPAAVRTSNAPPPPQPVGAGTRTAQPSLTELASSGNYESYKARRNADRGVTH